MKGNHNSKARPYLICHMATSVDGKIRPKLWPRIDELSQLVIPFADGSIGTSTLFDVEEGYTARRGTQLRLKSV